MKLIDGYALEKALGELMFERGYTIGLREEPCDWRLHGCEIMRLIDEAPTFERADDVRGQWIITGGMKPPEFHHHHECSVCGAYALLHMPWGNREELSPWCPSCGAKMDLEGENERPDTPESGD